MKQEILHMINSNEQYRERALEAMCENKVFVVVDGNRIVCFWRTRKGAEFGVKQDKDYYHDYNLRAKVQVTSPLQIVEFSADDIAGYAPEEVCV